jgi:Zn-finger nucleic acid-binding protein
LRDEDGFPCHCGQRVTARARRAHDSPVIRCSACGGSRDANASECSFCKAAFTIRERDLTGMCAACGTRAAGDDNYCHACGAVLVHSEQAATPGDKACPVCDGGQMLTHRQLDHVPLLECNQCGGIWLDRVSFGALAQRVSRQAQRDGFAKPRGTPRDVAPQPGPTYRRCVECNTIMQRKNYGTKSGVIVDICARHGTWFDALELDAVLAWLRAGGAVMPNLESPKLSPEQLRSLVEVTHSPRREESGWVFDIDIIQLLLDVFF